VLFSAGVAVQAAFATTGLGLCVVWAWRDGGYAPEEWLPGGLLLLALVCVASASAEVRVRLGACRFPLTLFGLYVAWSYMSVLWAQVPGDALEGANRTLVYWLAFTLFCGLVISERVGEGLVLAWGVAIAAAGCAALGSAAAATTPAGHFVLGRLAAPISYPDGNAALFLSACLALLVLATRREAKPVVRITAGAIAAVLVDLAVLCQSRGSLFALACTIALYLAVTRSRVRALGPMLLVGIFVAPGMPALLHVYSAVVTGVGRRGAVLSAAAWIAGSAVFAACGFTVLAVADRRLEISDRIRSLAGRILAAVAVLAVIAAAGFAALHNPLAHAERAWHNFTTNQKAPPTTPHFAAGLGTSRYDVWRIALGQFAAHPLAGVGSDNYLVGYLQQRRTGETSRYPESVILRTLSETGIVGAALFLGFLGVAVVRAVRAARSRRAPGLALACFAGFAYWLFHASIDWFWELPSLTGAALMLLALAASPTRAADPPLQRTRIGRLWVPATAAAALLAAGALAVPWVAGSLVDAAIARGPVPGAYSLLKTAAALNPLSEQPFLTEATLAANAGDRGRERHALLEALRRNPDDWYPYLMLGIVAGREHHLNLARRELARARRLSPRDQIVLYAQRRLGWRRPLTEREVGKLFREENSTLWGVRQR
jgi:O-antigen ligase